jgi:hypothetical protein
MRFMALSSVAKKLAHPTMPRSEPARNGILRV